MKKVTSVYKCPECKCKFTRDGKRLSINSFCEKTGLIVKAKRVKVRE